MTAKILRRNIKMNSQQEIEDYVNGKSYQNQQDKKKLGRLHLIKKCLKDSICRECNEKISKGSLCYRQNVYGDGPFSKQTKVCSSCAEIQIQQGIEIAPKKEKKDGTKIIRT